MSIDLSFPVSITSVGSWCIAVLQFGLPIKITIKDIQRMAEKSYLSVYTKVDGKIETVIERELFISSKSGGSGALRLWLSDLVEEEDVKKLTDKFFRGRYVFLPPPSKVII